MSPAQARAALLGDSTHDVRRHTRARARWLDGGARSRHAARRCSCPRTDHIHRGQRRHRGNCRVRWEARVEEGVPVQKQGDRRCVAWKPCPALRNPPWMPAIGHPAKGSRGFSTGTLLRRTYVRSCRCVSSALGIFWRGRAHTEKGAGRRRRKQLPSRGQPGFIRSMPDDRALSRQWGVVGSGSREVWVGKERCHLPKRVTLCSHANGQALDELPHHQRKRADPLLYQTIVTV